jgi:hypothetical protein
MFSPRRRLYRRDSGDGIKTGFVPGVIYFVIFSRPQLVFAGLRF